MKEQEYKETPIGRIPEEWEVVRLGNVLELLRNGLTYKQNKKGIGYPTTRIETISDGLIDPIKLGYIENLRDREIEEYRLKAGDILFSHINSIEHFAKTAIYSGAPPLLIHGMNLLLLRPMKEKIEPMFLAHYLKYENTRSKLRSWAKRAVNQVSLNQTELKRFKLFLPPLSEQRRIAEILSTIDQAIQRADEAIARTQRLKRGLMQELLTKGIGHKEFKDTEIGNIPKKWEVVKIHELFNVETGTTPSTQKKEYWEKGTINWFTPIDLSKLKERIFLEISERKITNKALKEANLTIVPEGSILISTRAPVGYVAVFKKEGTFNQGCKGLIPREPKEISSEFYCHYLMNIKPKLQSLSGGSTFKELPKAMLEKLDVPQLSLQEQQKIAEILSTVEKKLELERKRKRKFKKIKQGLMNDLLTGRKRVKVA